MAYDFREGFAPPFHDNFSWNAHQGLGRKEDGFVASLSWAEKGENISSVKPPSKAFHAFLSTPGESCSFGESHVGHKHQNTCTRQDQSRWLSRISVPSSLPSVQQVPFRMKGRQRPCSKNLFVPHLVFISPDGLFFFFFFWCLQYSPRKRNSSSSLSQPLRFYSCHEQLYQCLSLPLSKV